MTESSTLGKGCLKVPRGEWEWEKCTHPRCGKKADGSPRSTRPLNIRHLKTAYGDFVDLEERVVGDLFDDRGADGNIRNSILEVHRYPPRQDQVETSQRFSSLAPDSSARPRKRPLELSSQSPPSQHSRNMHREVPSIEAWDVEPIRAFETATKRQRTRGSRRSRTFDANQSLRMREEQGGGLYHSLQISGTQESIHQVPNSQKSPGKRRTSWLSCLSIALLMCIADSLYGTPTSLPFLGQRESVSGNDINLSAIPESPLGREKGATGGALQLDRESTKSESPELRASVLEVPSTNPIDASGEQPTLSANSPEPATSPPISNSASRAVSVPRNVDQDAMRHALGVKQPSKKSAEVNRTPKRRPSTAGSVHAQNFRSNSNSLCMSDPIFDYIESDTESFHEKQQMQSAKRLRSSKAPNASSALPRASNQARAGRKDDQFKVPSVQQCRTTGARISLGELTSSEQRENIRKPRRDPGDVNNSVQKDLNQQGKHDAKFLEHTRSEPCENDRTNLSREMSKLTPVENAVVDAPEALSQATTAWSPNYINPADGIGASIVQQGGSPVLSQEQEPNGKVRLGHDVHAVIRYPDDGRFTQKAERLAEQTEEKQEKKRVIAKKTEEDRLARETMGKENSARQEAADRKANEKRPEDGKGAKQERDRAEGLTQANKANAEEDEHAEARRIKETRSNAARQAEGKRITERLIRERQTKEKALVEQAKKVMLAADGAKQIEAEEKEIEKARQRELAANKQASEAKANEQAKLEQGKASKRNAREEQLAREKAQQLAHLESKDAKQRSHQARTAQDMATALKEHTTEVSMDRNVQKIEESPEEQSQASTTPLNISGPKRSMTTAIPRLSVAKTSPQESPLGSSTLSNRSSANMDAPLRSALRQTPSALRRSVSSVSFDAPPRSKLNEYIPSTPYPEAPKEINKQLATNSSAATNSVKTLSRTVSTAPSKAPVITPIPKKAPDSKITKVPAKTGKVQTKLNVTREVKKLKARAVNFPVTPVQLSKQEIILSSGEDSSSSKEPVWQTGNAKAGPSSRKPAFPVTISQGKKTAEVKPPSTPIDPTIRNIKIKKDVTAAPATFSRSTSKTDPTSLQKSTSRSPALALSETHSLSSGLASSPASDLKSESESASREEHQAPSFKTPTGANIGKLAPGVTKGVSQAIDMGVKQTGGHLKNKAPLLSSQAPSSRSRNSISLNGDGKYADRAAAKQLQLESRQSVPGSRIKEASSTNDGAADDKIINQGLDHAGRLPNGIRPANYKYPCLSELKKLRREATPIVKPKSDASSSQPLGASSAGKSETEESSSDNDDSSSNSDEDEDVDNPPSQSSSKTESRLFSGLRQAIKRRSSIPW